MIRDQLHAAFHEPSTRTYRTVQGVIWALIVLSIAMLIAEPFVPQEHVGLFRVVDNLVLWILLYLSEDPVLDAPE